MVDAALERIASSTDLDIKITIFTKIEREYDTFSPQTKARVVSLAIRTGIRFHWLDGSEGMLIPYLDFLCLLKLLREVAQSARQHIIEIWLETHTPSIAELTLLTLACECIEQDIYEVYREHLKCDKKR